jgi:Fe-only nitrogenase accessory protein AnfO
MSTEIALFLDREGKTASLTEQGKIKVFTHETGKWQLSREKEFTLESVQDMADFRDKMAELLCFLQDCKVLVGSKINGVSAVILARTQCRIWEREGAPPEILDRILSEERKADCGKDSAQERPVARPSFHETSPGNFTVSIVEIQEKQSPLTTKQALFPFLRQRHYNTLKIICSHLPPWLEGEALAGNFDIKTSTNGEHKQKVILIKKRD